MTRSGTGYNNLQRSHVEAVMQGRQNPIRSLDVMEAVPQINLAIQHVANHYGARDVVDEALLKECVRLVRQEFGRLAVVEIIQAYRLWAAKRFTALEMYGGKFNATQLARVLAGYREYRKAINQALARERNRSENEAFKAARKAAQQAAYLASRDRFPETLSEVTKNNRFTLPRQLPFYWYDFAEYHNLIHLQPGDKVKYCKRAKADIESYRDKALLKMQTGKNIVTLRSIIERFQQTQEMVVFTRGKQYILWEKVLGRKLPERKEQT